MEEEEEEEDGYRSPVGGGGEDIDLRRMVTSNVSRKDKAFKG